MTDRDERRGQISGPTEPVCRAAELTSVGRGALATVVVFGRQAIDRVSTCFRPIRKESLAEIPFGQVVLGHWYCLARSNKPVSVPSGAVRPSRPTSPATTPLGARTRGPAGCQFSPSTVDDDSAGEELIVCCHSEIHVEVNCHGGRAAVDRVLSSLQACGCTLTSAEAWVDYRANDRLCAEAAKALCQAPTERTAAILLDQSRGCLSRSLEAIRRMIEEREVAAAVRQLADLQAWWSLGQHLVTPWHVVIAGPVNAGKSSLLNALLGYRRAIVSTTAGTTRDVLKAPMAVDGWPVIISDTAGLRAAADQIEGEGIDRACEQMRAADVVLWVTDVTGRADPSWDLEKLNFACPVVRVDNKSDLEPPNRMRAGQGVRVSALCGHGLDELLDTIARIIVPRPPSHRQAVPFKPRHRDDLAAIHRSLTAGHLERAHQRALELQWGPDSARKG